MAHHPQKILVLALSGIGNLLMQLPTIETIKKQFPNSHLTVWVPPRGTKTLIQYNPAVDNIIVAPISRSLLRQLPLIIKLNRLNFDTAIMLSPGQHWKGALFMALAGIHHRIGHTYPYLGNPHSHLLLTDHLDEQPELHDTPQNLNLIKLLNTKYQTPVTEYHLNIPETKFAAAQKIIRAISSSPNAKFIGIHAGSAPNFPWKRWPEKNFASVAQTAHQQHNLITLIFGGPNEHAQKKKLRKLIGKKNSHIISADLLTTAAITTHCQLFLSNDSGLMHLAAASGTPTLGIFGPTDEKQTGPLGKHASIIRAPGTKPVYNTAANYDLGNQPHSSLLQITPDMVTHKINQLLTPPSAQPQPD